MTYEQMRNRATGVCLTAFICAAPFLSTSEAFAQNRSYVVKKGDTCAAIAAQFYGDSRLVEPIHTANNMTSPPPHTLKEGTTLIIPPKPVAQPAAPDAKVGFVRNKVEVQAPAPKPATPAEPLFRGNRVSTQSESAAGVLFRDESRYTLGENTLIVILGDMRSGAQKLTTGQTTLVSGEVRTRLGDLAVKSPHVIQTDSAQVSLGKGEALIVVDAKKTSRVSVHEGSANLSAQHKRVTVPEGFGSKAELGKAPTPPHRLPSPPIITDVPGLLLTDGAAATASVHYAPGQDKPDAAPVQHWHVQIARDNGFTDIVTDVRTPLAVNELKASLAPGETHYAHVSGVDGDFFEGKYSQAVVLRAVHVAQSVTADNNHVVSAPGLVCSIDGAADVAADNLAVPGDANHTLRCASKDNLAVRAELALAALALPALNVAQHVTKESKSESQVELLFTDASGKAIEVTPKVTLVPKGALAQSSALVSAPEAVGQGIYRVTIYWRGTVDPHALSVDVTSRPHIETAAINPPKTVAGGSLGQPSIEFESGIGFLSGGNALSDSGGRAFVGIALRAPIEGGAAVVGLRGGHDAYANRAVDPGACGCNGVNASYEAWSLEMPLAVRFGRKDARWLPYVQLTPGILAQSGTYSLAPSGTRDSSAILLQLGAHLGLNRKLGPGALFGELGYRGTSTTSYTFANTSQRGLMASFGYRIGFDL